MKKNILIISLLASFGVSAQKIIIDEKFEKNNVPLFASFQYDHNKVVIQKGKIFMPSSNNMITNLNSYDSNGTKEELISNVEWLNIQFSDSENIFYTADYQKSGHGGKYRQFFVNNKALPKIDTSEKKKYNQEDVMGYQFNDLYEIGLSNENEKEKIDIERNDIYLELTEISAKRNHKRIKLEKPDIERLKGNNLVKPTEELGFYLRALNNETFEIVTKSISKDYKTTILYRTIYDFEGKKVNEVSYTVTLTNFFPIYSRSSYTKLHDYKFSKDDTQMFSNDLGINNFIEDPETGDVYVYGLLGKKARGLNEFNQPDGYYVFKFDKTGKKIWESENQINDEKDLNEKMHLVRMTNSLRLGKTGLTFTASKFLSSKFLHYALLDPKTGKVTKTNKIDLKLRNEVGINNFRYNHLIKTADYSTDELKGKFFDSYGLIAYETNENYKKYINSLNSDTKTYFRTMFGKDGCTWLLESDNETYYKLNYFN